MNKKTISLYDFYDIIQRTVLPRKRLTRDIFNDGTTNRQEDISVLREAYAQLGCIPERGGKKLLSIGSRIISTDLGYEIEELKRDVMYLEQGEDALNKYLKEFHPAFDIEVEKGVAFLDDLSIRVFISDRDGTVNNYCGRYLSSLQSIYNSVFLSRFSTRVEESVLLTAAPLDDIGIVDISINPPGLFTYAGSKGREYIDKKGEKFSFPISAEKQDALDRLNQELSALVNNKEYEIYTYIGSGLQFKFGQTTLARQDIYSSIPADKSEALLETVRDLIDRIDPQGATFKIEDTGKDIEIILTVEGGSADAKDYDKGDGVRYLDQQIPLHLKRGTPLICGDTQSDLSMVKASMEQNPQTRVIFVTQDIHLIDQLKEICSRSLTVSSPDVLITILDKFSKGRCSYV